MPDPNKQLALDAMQIISDGSFTTTEYALDNSEPQAEQRFGALEDLFDGQTTAYLAQLGVSPGWSCWELGPGSGSIARWLARTVGATGSVLATDLDLRWFRDDGLPGLTSAVHNVVCDPAPEGAFDLVHARLVLVHLREREQVLGSLARSLRPGGWMLIEDFDQAFLGPAESVTVGEPNARRVQHALLELLARRGADSSYGRRLPDLLHDAGLREVGGEGRMSFASGGSPASRLMKANFQQLGDELMRSGLCTGTELNTALERLDDARHRFATSMMVSAWGRRPKC